MAKKTIKVEDLLNKINGILAKSDADKVQGREAAMMIIEDILHETGNYRGFRYLTIEDMFKNQACGQPGVHYVDGKLLDYPERFENTDRTRVEYFN